MKAFKLLIISTSLLLSFTSFSQENIRIITDEGNVLRVKSRKGALSELGKYTVNYITELQETIDFNKGISKRFGVGISNSRKIHPMSNGDFIVADTTSLSGNYHLDALKNSSKSFLSRLSISGQASPSLKRFFISSASDSSSSIDYVTLDGPYNLPVVFGIDDELYDIGAGVRLNDENHARYNKWFSRFTSNIKDFPLTIREADQMAIGEGFSFAFEGAAFFGPSSFLEVFSESKIFSRADFSLRKILKSGRFELIVFKSQRDKLIFSIRQSRTVGGNNFEVKWGGSAGPNLEVVFGTSQDSLIPDIIKVVSFKRERRDATEDRYNAVYEIDLRNPVDREIYDKSMSGFDFSLFEVFTFKDLSATSNILKKFRASSLKLILDTRRKVESLTRTSVLKYLIGKRSFYRSRESHVDGDANYGGRKVKTAGGELLSVRERSSIFRGKDKDEFEIKAFEEYGNDGRSDIKDVVLLMRRTLVDNRTLNRADLENDPFKLKEFSTYKKSFNTFTKSGQGIQMHADEGVRDLGTTKGFMEFFLTRNDIATIARYADEAALKNFVIGLMVERVKVLNASIPNRKIRQIKRQDPSQWRFALRPKIKKAYGKIILGHRALKKAFSIRDESRRKAAIARALSYMLSFPAIGNDYARIFRFMLVKSGEIPKINIIFSNAYLRKDFKEISYQTGEMSTQGLVLEESIDRALEGISYYDRVNRKYLRKAYRSGSKIIIDFKNRQDFRGVLKIILKQSSGEASNTHQHIGEFIIDLNHFSGNQYVFNLRGGESRAEDIAQGVSLISNEVYIALSLDGNAYDEEIKLD